MTFPAGKSTIGAMTGKKRRKRMGRPPKRPAERRSVEVNVSMTRAERALLRKRAKALGVSVSELLMGPWRKGD